MSKGYVYILTNPSMPGLVKIGKTTRTPQQRCDELWQTGVPTPFEVYAAILSPDCHALEGSVHRALADDRVTSEREFFAIDPERARFGIEAGAQHQVEQFVREFLPDHTIIHESLAPNEEAIFKQAEIVGEGAEAVSDAYSFLTIEEIKAAVGRRRELNERIADHWRHDDNVVPIHG